MGNGWQMTDDRLCPSSSLYITVQYWDWIWHFLRTFWQNNEYSLKEIVIICQRQDLNFFSILLMQWVSSIIPLSCMEILWGNQFVIFQINFSYTNSNNWKSGIDPPLVCRVAYPLAKVQTGQIQALVVVTSRRNAGRWQTTGDGQWMIDEMQHPVR